VLSVEIGIRRTGREGDRAAAAYVHGQLSALGLDARLVPFTTPAGDETWNVVAGVGTSTPYLLVGAHYDTVAASPGGNDNGTGTASLIEVARALRAQPARLPVALVAFGAEEVQPGPKGTHHLGSRAYVTSMNADARRNLAAMLSIDEVGYGRSLVFGRLSVGPQEATQRLLRVAAQLGIAARERVTPDWSDNGPFLKAGLNAGWLWSGEDPAYHSPRDTFEHVQWDSVERAGRLLLAVLRSY
jgi:Zn-dependent M28 family amino/carboxypeptidase